MIALTVWHARHVVSSLVLLVSCYLVIVLLIARLRLIFFTYDFFYLLVSTFMLCLLTTFATQVSPPRADSDGSAQICQPIAVVVAVTGGGSTSKEPPKVSVSRVT